MKVKFTQQQWCERQIGRLQDLHDRIVECGDARAHEVGDKAPEGVVFDLRDDSTWRLLFAQCEEVRELLESYQHGG